MPLILGGFEIDDKKQQNQYHIRQKLNDCLTMLECEAPTVSFEILCISFVRLGDTKTIGMFKNFGEPSFSHI